MFSEIRQALLRGIDLVNDVAESNVLAGIKNKDPGYTKYWLSHRHEAYKKPFTHRQATTDIFEMIRIEDYYRHRRKLENILKEQNKEDLAEKAEKARAFMDRWLKGVG